MLPQSADFERLRLSRPLAANSPPDCLLLARAFLSFKSHHIKKENHLSVILFFYMVAGVGLEPHDLRVMSPTSYHLLYPASKVYLNDSLFIIP